MEYTIRRVLLYLIIIFACFSLFGCEGVVVYGVGKTYLDKEQAKIHITEEESSIASCEFIKKGGKYLSLGRRGITG
ncbi:MAG: hypothetical protein U9R02_12065 [Thermodesulfobacteriota bacterium]|nr:hypothetical protein [Thermodesulfobacteriota bacterium]